MKQFSKNLTNFNKYILKNKILKRNKSKETVPEIFGINVFNMTRLEKRLPREVYKRYERYLERKEEKLDEQTTELIATVLKDWCEERGVSHYSHWFQPLTGATAEKHDSFLKHEKGHVINNFSGKALREGECDGSSFPNGGLRQTHQARGYTMWDGINPPFIMETGGVPTLFIPTIFYSWTGEALDTKLPLLRAQVAMNKEAKNLFEECGLKDDHFQSLSGVEQEFFLVDQKHYLSRPDLLLAGRSLQGTSPSKGQELCDSYFGSIAERAWKAINEMEVNLWKLGIPITTRHREVAPNQYEIAPIFENTTIATDHNMMTMEVMQRVASKYGLAVLFHEKPFKGVNGSGKHNNFSIFSNKSGVLFEPGKDPLNNIPFLLSLAATVRGVDLHQDLMRFSISGASNDHRLGAHEAPPAIFSIYLGDDVNNIFQSLISNENRELLKGKKLDFKVPYLSEFIASATDRNRTSPFAFTGNRFEVRGVGSSQSPAFSNIILNTIMAESFKHIASVIKQKKKSGMKNEEAIRETIRETFKKHERIVFNGNGYSEEWKKEASQRGLLNLRTTPDTLDYIQNEKNFKLLEDTEVLTKKEFEMYINVSYENYSKRVSLEAFCLANMSNRSLLPASVSYLNELNEAKLTDRANQIQKLIELGFHQTDKLKKEAEELENLIDQDLQKSSRFAVDNILPTMNQLRSTLDTLESLIPKNKWPYPGYEDMLFHQHI